MLLRFGAEFPLCFSFEFSCRPGSEHLGRFFVFSCAALQKVLPNFLQVLSTRKRKDANAAEIKVQVAIFAFDLLYLNGEALVRKPFSERRGRLREVFAEVPGEFLFAKSADPETMEEVQEILELSVKGRSKFKPNEDKSLGHCKTPL